MYISIIDNYNVGFLNLLFMIFLFISSMISEDLKLIPGSFQRIFEMVVEFIFDLIKQQ